MSEQDPPEQTEVLAPPLAAAVLSETQQQQQQQHTTTTLEEKVLEDPDLLERVFAFLPTAADLARCAAVNSAFCAASGAVGAAMLARKFPAAAALQEAGLLELNKGRACLFIVAFFVCSIVHLLFFRQSVSVLPIFIPQLR
jgi:hypothetical protein